MRIRYAIAGTIVAAVATIAPTAAQATHSQPAWMTTPCAQEDSSDCYWDASKAGNGVGHSFYAVRTAHGRVCVLYWGDRYARHHNHCTRDAYPRD